MFMAWDGEPPESRDEDYPVEQVAHGSDRCVHQHPDLAFLSLVHELDGKGELDSLINLLNTHLGMFQFIEVKVLHNLMRLRQEFKQQETDHTARQVEHCQPNRPEFAWLREENNQERREDAYFENARPENDRMKLVLQKELCEEW